MIVDCHGHYNTVEGIKAFSEKYLKDKMGLAIKDGLIPAWKSFEEKTTLENWITSLRRRENWVSPS